MNLPLLYKIFDKKNNFIPQCIYSLNLFILKFWELLDKIILGNLNKLNGRKNHRSLLVNKTIFYHVAILNDKIY